MLRFMREHTKVIMVLVILFFVASCFVGYGLYARGGGQDGQKDYPVAEASGKKIMRSEIERNMQRVAEQYGGEITSQDLPLLRKSALEAIVVEREIAKEIKDRGISVADSAVDTEYGKLMDSYPTREEFLETMKHSGKTENDVKNDIKEQLKMQKLFESIEAEIKIEDKEVKAFYDSTKEFIFKEPAGTKTNIAYFSKKEDADGAHKAIVGGTKWDAEIAKYSTVSMATSYDKPIVITDEMLGKEDLKAIKDLPLNKLSNVEEVPKMSLYYFAIKRGRSTGRIIPFDEAKDRAKGMIKEQKMREAQGKLANDLYKRAEVKILDASIFPAPETDTSATSGDVSADKE
ncbi:MAG: SurA N-terminal domain-containing protein [Synergistes sp.]|nr:SurA N-terminal domain-containing protein [Synergistes sp.]